MKSFAFLGLTIIICCALLMNGSLVLAEDDTGSDDEISFDNETVVSQDQVVSDDAGKELQDKHLGFSGKIAVDTMYNSLSPEYDWTGLGGQEYESLANQIMGDFDIDVRLQNGVKGFLSVGLNYDPGVGDEEATDLQIKEFFVDNNWHNKVYFRTGKQVLKWGRSYFWNPTDLINIDKKDFIDMDQAREGTFGAKIHIPSGVKQNTYFFVGMNDAQKTGDVFLASKYELLLNKVEMSISAWTKNGYHPIYGYDFSGRLFDLNIYGEMSLTDGEDYNSLDYDSLLVTSKKGEIIPQISIGFAKSFDTKDIQDRINIAGELYYNQAGYDRNILQRIENIEDPVQKTALKTTFLSIYQPYVNYKYYLAFFSSINKFIGPEMILNFNGMVNLVDKSSTLTIEMSYAPPQGNYTISFNINGNLGDKNSEATMTGNRMGIGLQTKIVF